MRVSISLALTAIVLASSASVLSRSLTANEHALKRHQLTSRTGGMVKTYVKRADADKPKQCSKASKPRDAQAPLVPADQEAPGSPGYGSDAGGKDNSSDTDGVHARGILSSSHVPLDSTVNPKWFDPSFVYHGPGTTFGGGNNFWQGGACMLDDLPHANLPSVAMDQTYWQDGLACGACVEIASTTAAQFSNSAVWKVEQPVAGQLDQSKKTVAIVSDLCPGVGQCFSGLDMHPDTWSSVTGNANGSKLPINWRFVSCKEAFKSTGSGGKSLQVHWRSGANPGFCQVQIRGSYQAVVRVEAKVGNGPWMSGKHVDSSFWSFENKANTIDATTDFVFRLTDWQGQSITTEVPTKMGHDVFISANFEEARV